MEALERAEAVTNGGLRGDRYTDYQVTFIELENIEAFTQSTGLALAGHAAAKYRHARDPAERAVWQALSRRAGLVRRP
jgi:hypothetical protein